MIYPFDTHEFKSAWDLYKRFRKDEHKFKFKSKISEQASLKKIGRISKNKEEIAIAIIHQSIENNWRGLFPLKDGITKSEPNTIMSSIDNW